MLPRSPLAIVLQKPTNSLKFILELTVVSVASQSPSSPQKSVGVPLSMALGQQFLTVQQATQSSPAKGISNHSTQQGVKPVQTMTVSGVGTPQFKTIIPLTTPQNVQQIQVPGSKFHYVRLVTASTGNSSPQTGSPSINSHSLQQAKPVVVNTTPVRMSVPIVSAHTMKQVVPKSLNANSQIVSTPSQQRLIMPATSLPQIQPNLTNLPPGTVLTPAPGSGNVGYAVLPAQYVTQATPAVSLCDLGKQYWFCTRSSSCYPDPGPVTTQWVCQLRVAVLRI
ncbi:LIN54 protein, partial [Polyodon spathula]|nr:LIN54 protein [Polyodon spathula]